MYEKILYFLLSKILGIAIGALMDWYTTAKADKKIEEEAEEDTTQLEEAKEGDDADAYDDAVDNVFT